MAVIVMAPASPEVPHNGSFVTEEMNDFSMRTHLICFLGTAHFQPLRLDHSSPQQLAKQP